MSAKGLLFAMVAGTALVIFVGARDLKPPRKPPVTRPLEAPWLSKEAAAQIIGADGNLGPLFADVELGGSPPSPAVRARIAEFARANHVEIDLDVEHEELAAVRFAVSYGGCCGYEGADVLAMRLGRPHTGSCSGPDTWIDDWTQATDEGTHMRARVRVNRVEVLWQHSMTLADVLTRADDLLGMNAKKVGKVARGGWFEIEGGHRYLLALPFRFISYPPYSAADMRNRDDLGVQVGVDNGQITEVSFSLRDAEDEIRATLRAHWGRPHEREGTWTWRTADRIVTAGLDEAPRRVTIQKRATTGH